MNRIQQPHINSIDNIGLWNSEHYELDNGLKVHQIDAGTQDVVKIEFIFEAGICQQTKKLMSILTNKMLAEGTNNYTAYQIAEKIDTYGAFLSTSVDKDFSSIALYSLNKHLSKLLPILEEIILKPSFHKQEFDLLLNKLEQEFIVNQEKVKHLAQTNFNRLMFGENTAYGQMANSHDFKIIELDDIKQFYLKKYSLSNCNVFVSGKITPDFKNLFNKHFGTESSREFAKNSNDFKLQPTQKLKHKIVKKNAMQSAIRIGKPLFNLHHPDFLGLLILNTILGGYFGSRLMANIREDKGYTYGIGSSVFSLKHSGLFTIITEVGSNYLDASLEEIYKEIIRLQKNEVSQEELALVKNYILGQMIRSMDGPFSRHEKLKSTVLQGLDLSHYQKRLEVVKNIDSSQLMTLANKHLQLNSLIELIVGA